MRIERVTRYVPTRNCSALSGSESAFVGVSLPRVTILERPDPDARPTWKGRPADMVEPARQPRFLNTRYKPAPAPVVVVLPKPEEPVEATAEPTTPAPDREPVWNRTEIPLDAEDQDGLTARAMLKILATAFGSSTEEMRGERRGKYVVRTRMAIIWALIKHYPNLSLAEVGRRLNRDHTTIIRARNKVTRCLTACGLSTAPQATPYDTACLALRALGGGE